MDPETLIQPTAKGLYCPPGGFYIDPTRAVEKAIVTHGHADHARAGHDAVMATPETLAIMACRYGKSFAVHSQPLAYGERQTVNGVTVWLAPAGHVLGSAQVVLEYQGLRIVASGDYKRRRDPTCAAFQPVACDVFITEATFGLPVFQHPADDQEIKKVLHSMAVFPDRTHLVGAYSLGKAQRVIALLREAGYADPIYIHGALENLCRLYERHGIPLGSLAPAKTLAKTESAGKLVLAPPSALNDRWSRRLIHPLTVFASGWMRVKARAKQIGVELPLVLSDHADWRELTETIEEIKPRELWVTHGREDALVHFARSRGIEARPLRLVGYGEEDGDAVAADDPPAQQEPLL